MLSRTYSVFSSRMDIRRKRTISLATPCTILLIFLLVSWRLMRGSNTHVLQPQIQPETPTTPTTASPTPPNARNTTRALIIARLKDEDTTWADTLHESHPDLTIDQLAIYTANDPYLFPYTVNDTNYNYSVPQNKGHEVMVYLTYIIDHYDSLQDVSIFMHSHLHTWHNNDFLDSSSAEMVARLRTDRVLRHGYMNLRCHHQPGCPDHIHPRVVDKGKDDELNIPEAAIIGTAWTELFPEKMGADGHGLPEVLSQPCCGQFAVSRDAIRAVPRERYIFFRDWLLKTDLEDRLSGRVWEYTWQYIFAGVEVFCPDEYECYCDGYGVCFESREQYQHWFEMRDEVRALEAELQSLEEDEGKEEGKPSVPDKKKEAKKLELESKIAKLRDQMDREKELAVAGGKDGKGR
ncbi:hypothetical protein M432DRAFT_433182 [Thermoascus aurantiacus ATCC 26904]